MFRRDLDESSPRISATRARIPPSPLLSARMTNSRYLMLMTTTSDQNTSERRPRTFVSVTASSWPCPWNVSRKA